MEMSRRDFVARGLAASSGLFSGVASAPPLRSAMSPASHMKLGLYSITFLGVWYRGEALTVEDVIRRAKKYGYDGVEIDGKRPHGNPLDMPPSRCKEVRARAESEGIEIYGVAANNDFSSPIPEHRECQIVYVRELIRMAANLGAKTVRMFLAWPGITKHPQVGSYDIARVLWRAAHERFTAAQTWAWCRDGMAECARYAGDAGITLALQNHKPVINTHWDVLRMVREVNSPHLKVSLDAPIMPIKTPAAIRQAARDVGPLQALSHFGGEYDRGPDGEVKGEPFYAPFVKAMKEIGYRGYIGYELCHPLPKVKGQTVGIEYAEKNAQLAAEFMRGLIQSEGA